MIITIEVLKNAVVELNENPLSTKLPKNIYNARLK